ncbi:MAG: bifunctional methylenetetrahydrofolate dehydrogenase/methenyltetrahydrofolate cyclohydrolase, partial [Acidobacteriota bacterium]|nr:bifunctional methylenetetrahydrofolate dehydrogenase/methenyltetrahydrofolate cyclohydrolase [Acidobacteriota bacterium]
MSGVVLDGKKISREIQEELRPRIGVLEAEGKTPGLAVILVGDNPASQIYVRNKIKACHDLGIRSFEVGPSGNISTGELIELIRPLTDNPAVNGILVQMPLPPQIDAEAIGEFIDPMRDVDGFGTQSLGRLVQNKPAPRACTPAGIMEMLRRYNV